MDRQLRSGKISEDEINAAMGRIKTTLDLAELGTSDLIIEAATEDESVKQKIFDSVLPHLKPETILISVRHQFRSRAWPAVRTDLKIHGLPFANPVPVMQLVELIRGIATDQDTHNSCLEVVNSLEKLQQAPKIFPLLIVNRIPMPMINEAVYTLYEGVDLFSQLTNP